MADLFFKAILVQYAVAAVAYACSGRWQMATYFAGATLLNVAVLLMGGNS